MSRYQGLPPDLKRAVFERDNWRCRWCGSTNRYGYDVHHIQYRRGYSYDRLDNLITVCRSCHTFVHDSYAIPKALAQQILTELISDTGAGSTGLALWRRHAAAETRATSPTDEAPTSGRLLTGSTTPGRLMKGITHEHSTNDRSEP